jgi:hypothetical protein
MTRIHVSRVIDAPIDAVWAIARDFTGHWHSSTIANSTIEAGEPSDRVGCVRHFEIAGGGGELREELTELSDQRHSFTYRILESPLPVSNYVATVTLRPITVGGGTFGEWAVDFDVPAEAESDIVALVTGVFEGGLEDLARLTASG